MDCPACGHANAADARFCRECGQPLTLSCAQCGRALEPGAKFCDQCGTAVGAAPASTASRPDSADAGTPPVAPGERRQATVLFSDLVGFTALTERLDPEEVEGVMRRLKQQAVEIVEAHGGIVSQFVGDEVLALFGIPTAHEDDPIRAVRAAQALHTLARELSEDVAGRIDGPLALHTGIDSGLVVTSTADDRDGRVGVTGDTVNTAARLKAAAEPETILLGPEAQRRVSGFFDTEPEAAIDLKGKAEPLVPHRVTGAKGIATRFEAAAARGLTAFAGRSEELATLQRVLDRALAGEGQFVTVIGEAGVGKSRLAFEFRHSIDRQTVTVLEGRCQSYGAETPYLPFLDALRRGLRLEEGDSPETLREKAVANVLAIDPALERYLPHLLHLLSIPSDAHKLPDTLQGEALRRELEEALLAAFVQNTRQGPMVVILEDWHWADEASDSALQHLTTLVGHHPLLLLILYRPEYTRSWGELEHYTAIVLKALDVANTEAMLRAVIGADLLPEGLGEAIHARTGGNALFNEEVARSLVEEGIVSVTDGTASLNRPLAELHLPDSVHAVIRARVDRLAPDDREVLRLASVIGREFDRAVLEKIASSRQQVGSALERLARQDLVHQVRVVPQAEYLFKHVLTQEVVRETLLHSQRKQLHAAVGAAIETIYASRLEEHYEALADHYEESEKTEKAVEFLEKAGDKAAAVFSLGEARGRFEAAFRRIRGLNLPPDDKARYVDMACRWAAISIGLPTETNIEGLALAQQFAEQLDDMHRIAAVRAWKGYVHLMLGQVEEATEDTEFVVALEEKLGGRESLGIAYSILGRIQLFTHRPLEAIEHLERARDILAEAGTWNESGYSSGLCGLAHSIAGDFDSAARRLDWARELGQTREIPDLLAWVYMWTSQARGMAGEWEECLRHGEQGRKVAESIQNAWTACWCVVPPARAAILCGDVQLGMRLTEYLDSEYERIGALLMHSWVLAYQATNLLLCGRRDQSERTALRALDMKQQGDNMGEAWALEAIMLLAASTPDPNWDGAREHANTAIAICRRDGARPQLAITHFRYAECLHKQGDLDAAREQLDQAEALFREMGMDWWTAQAEGLRGRIDRGEPFKWFAPYVDGPPQLDA